MQNTAIVKIQPFNESGCFLYQWLSYLDTVDTLGRALPLNLKFT